MSSTILVAIDALIKCDCRIFIVDNLYIGESSY